MVLAVAGASSPGLLGRRDEDPNEKKVEAAKLAVTARSDMSMPRALSLGLPSSVFGLVFLALLAPESELKLKASSSEELSSPSSSATTSLATALAGPGGGFDTTEDNFPSNSASRSRIAVLSSFLPSSPMYSSSSPSLSPKMELSLDTEVDDIVVFVPSSVSDGYSLPS